MEKNNISDHDEFPDSDHHSDHSEETKSERGPIIKSKVKKERIIVTYNRKGVPVGEGAKELASFEGVTARNMVPITYECWLDVPKEKKDELWQYVLAHYVLDPNSRKQCLQSIGTKWRNFKHSLYKNYIVPVIDNPKVLAERPLEYQSIKEEEWKEFVAKRLSKKWQEKSNKAKNVRAQHKYNHRLSRKGYSGLTAEIMQETGKTEEEIDRAMLWKEARKKKTGGFDENVQGVVDKIDELRTSGKFESSGTHDVLTEALGTTEQRGRVRGMGKFVTPNNYFFVPKAVKRYMDNKQKQIDERLDKFEDELEKLKRGTSNVSEGASCHLGVDYEDFDDDPIDKPLDNSCLLAVDVVSYIVAKGSITKHSVSGDNVEVMVDICIQGEAFLPIPIEEEFIVQVKDAIGHILSWPRHLVIRSSDLEKVVNRKRIKNVVEESENKEDIKRLKKDDNRLTTKIDVTKATHSPQKVDKKMDPMARRRMTRTQRSTRIRIERSATLQMATFVVDNHVSKDDLIRVQCEDGLFGCESFTYLNLNDFEAIFTLQELTGAVITSYMMLLYEKVKNTSKKDHGICFVNPTTSSPNQRKGKQQNIDDCSRGVADRMYTRKDVDNIVLVPYNPGNHWVLAVLDMKTTKCYYLDSLRPDIVDLQLRQIIDGAMGLYTKRIGSNKRIKFTYVNSKCPRQPGLTECGYYMLKFMKEIVDKGIKVLVKDQVGGGKEYYTDADIDGIREDWFAYVTKFIFR